MTTPNKQIRGIRQSIGAGSVLGRKSPGVGAVEEVTVAELTTAIINTGQVLTSGGSNPQEWTAGKVGGVSPGLTVTAGELIADWQITTIVAALGANITINSGTLEVAQEWQAGTVTSLGSNVSIVAGTLEVTSVPQEWEAGTVTALGPNLSISGTTLEVSLPAGGVLPLVNGDLPGPSLIADPSGQCVGVPL